MTYGIALLAAGASVLALTGPAATAAPPLGPESPRTGAARSDGADEKHAADRTESRHPQRGDPVSVTPVDTMPAAGVSAYLDGVGLDTSRVRSGVRSFRVVYQTIRPDGSPTTASQLLVLPRRHGASVDQAMWLHGTTLYRRSVASMDGAGTDRPKAYAIAAAGYAVTAPDYVGLGQSSDRHPYGHLDATASASVDALRATRSVLAERHLTPSREVYVTGHSQGGAAALVTSRALPEIGLRPAVIAPLSGAFEVGGLLDATLRDEIPNGSAYIAYLATAWNRTFRLYPSDEVLFRPPYKRTVPVLMNGEHPENQVLPQLPERPRALLSDRVINDIRQRRAGWGPAIDQASGSCDWRPPVAVHLFTAEGDRDIPPWQADWCQKQIRAHGGTATVTDVGDVDHSTMAIRSLPQVIAEFDDESR